ncbi:hypothetical protein Aperf_G00000051421 [Anoplocephala perfoliata]
MRSSSGRGLLPPHPILSSTQLGDASTASPRRRRRLRRVDLDEEEDIDVVDISEIHSAPFPEPILATSSPIVHRYDDDSEEDGEGVDDRRSPDYSRDDDIEVASIHSAEGDRAADVINGEDADGLDLDVKTLKQLKEISEGARKKKVRRPMPKLDPPTLLGERGLPALLKEIEKVKFRGRGHEFEDLERLMFIYESWANRMLPKFTFTEVMERLEVVGTKREVHNALQGMRAGTWPPALSAEFVHKDSDTDSENERPKATADDLLNDEELQELLRLRDTEPEPRKSPSPLLPIPSTSTTVLDDVSREEAVARRIERNRLAAMERLEAKRRTSSQLQSATPVRRGPSSLRKALQSVNLSNENTQ